MPFQSLRQLIRVFLKSIVLLIVLNFIFVAVNVDPFAYLYRVNTWSLVGHGRSRLFYQNDNGNGVLPLDLLVVNHKIAYAPKRPDEYRVIVLGDSAVMGWKLPDNDAFTEQLNKRQLLIEGKHVVAYNLAFPGPSLPKDILILDSVKQYQPDLVIWFVTTLSFRNNLDTAEDNLSPNRTHLESIANHYGLQSWFDSYLPQVPSWNHLIAIQHPEIFGTWATSLFAPYVALKDGPPDNSIQNMPIPQVAYFHSGQALFDPMPSEIWKFLLVGQKITSNINCKLMIVNEPILIGSGANSDRNYDPTYERVLYDKYRKTLTNYADQNKLQLVDLWNVVPSGNFTDAALHMDKNGWQIVLDDIIPKFASLNTSTF